MTDLLSEAPTRHPGYLLAMIEWLPDDGAFAAMLQHQPPPGQGKSGPPGPQRFLGWGRTQGLLADIWDLQAAAAMAGSKKKPPTYPRPKARGSGGTPLLAMAPKARRRRPPLT